MIKKAVFIVVSLLLSVNIHTIEISKENTITIDQEKVILQRIINFSITEDGYFLFPDMKAGNIKIYNQKGKLKKVWGRRGPGPDEFFRPAYSSYNKPYFLLMDLGKRKLSIFKKEKGVISFKKINEILILASGYDFKFISPKKILVSGYKADSNGKEYDLYFLNPQSTHAEFLLPSHLKYGFSTHQKYKNKYLSNIAPIGIYGYCDDMKNNIYFAWNGNLNILKINGDSKKISHFGKNTKNYIQPHVSPQLLKLYNERSKQVSKEMQKISYVTGIFADEGFVGVTYANFKKEIEGWQTIVQFYSHDGVFLKEAILPGAINTTTYADPSFCYVKESNTLYYLARTMDEEFNDIFKILKFKITL
jgi:hypothetical protein